MELRKDILNGLWTINSYEFYVEIEISSASDNEGYYRLINQNELAAIQTQISVSNTDGKNEINEQFLGIFKDMEEYLKIIQYFNSQGIKRFEKIKRKKYESFKQIFSGFNIKQVYQNSKKLKYLSKNITFSAFRNIGNVIQTNENPYDILFPYIKCIVGDYIPIDIFYYNLRKFIEENKDRCDVLFDTFKLGHEFCLYFSQQMLSKIEKIYQEYPRYFPQATHLRDMYESNNLIFLKVSRPVHCYHCIYSVAQILSYFINRAIYLNDKSLIFCQSNGNFSEKIHSIPSTNDSNIKKFEKYFTYFIIHPEMLNEEDHLLLIEFLNARLNSKNYTKRLPKVVVISSFSYSHICFNYSLDFNQIEFTIDDEMLSFLYELSNANKDVYHYHLYYSEKAGAGKTYQIYKEFEKMTKKWDFDISLKSFFVDASMPSLPEFNKILHYVHYDLSPDLFNNNYTFFDDLWVFATLKYHINSDGTSMDTPPTIFFEVPVLTEKQFPGGGFISKYDFPIAVDTFHKISVKEEDVKESEINNPFYDINPAKDLRIELPETVKSLCDKVFKHEINLASELLMAAAHLFYSDHKFSESSFVPRILEEFNLFMSEFCSSLVERAEDPETIPIFLLLLRTNFHVWNMESLFAEQNQPKSFMIIANKSLFSNEPDRSKWILLCFSSLDESDELSEWNTSVLKDEISDQIGDIGDSTLLENGFFTVLKNHKDIEIYSNQLNYVNDQSYFFHIIRSFFYLKEKDDSDYTRITDGIILNHFKHLYDYPIFEKGLIPIKEGKEIYESKRREQKLPAWDPLFDIISSILKKYPKHPIETIYELASNDKVKTICDITLTMMVVKRFIIMIIRIILKRPIIFEGFTGVGKTLCVQLLSMLVEIVPRNIEGKDGFKWSFHQIECHGALQLEEVMDTIREYTNPSTEQYMNQIIFFDELNTSPISSYIINQMNNYFLKNELNLSDNERSFVYMAAINPYIKIDKLARSLSRVGIKQVIPTRVSKLNLCCIPPEDMGKLYDSYDLNNLAYNALELSNSSKMIVLKSDPEFFCFDESEKKFNQENELSCEYYPPEESKTVLHIVLNYLNYLENQTSVSKDPAISFKGQQFISHNLIKSNLPYIIHNNRVYILKKLLRADLKIDENPEIIKYDNQEYINEKSLKMKTEEEGQTKKKHKNTSGKKGRTKSGSKPKSESVDNLNDLYELSSKIIVIAGNVDESSKKIFMKIVNKDGEEQEVEIKQGRVFINVKLLKEDMCAENNYYSRILKVLNPNGATLTTIHENISNKRNDIANIIHSLLSKSFSEIRELMKLKSILSYRDVKRFMQFFIHFFRKLVNNSLSNKEAINSNTLLRNIIPRSIVLSIMISIVFRFSDNSKIETCEGFLSESAERDEEIIQRFDKFGLKIRFSEDNKYYFLSIRSALLKMLTELEWSEDIPKPDDWLQVVRDYSWLKCSKYIYDSKNGYAANYSLFKLNSLMTHLFAISSCYSISKSDEGSVISCLIIGMPGTSKTLAIQLFTDYKKEKSSNKSKLFSTTYLSTRVSEAECLNAHYRDCASFMLSNVDSMAVCVIDELGLANLNETRPLTLLHYYFDKGIKMYSEKKSTLVPVMSIAASNYALDYASMNRGILICTDLPSDEDIARAFCLSELEANGDTVDFEHKNFFGWERNNISKINDYKFFLTELWKLTKNKQRPEMLTLRPLYLLFNSLSEIDDYMIDNLCLYLTSVISCSPSDSFNKLYQLIESIADRFNLYELRNRVETLREDANIALRQIFDGPKGSPLFKLFCEIVRDKENKKHLSGLLPYLESADDDENFNRLHDMYYADMNEEIDRRTEFTDIVKENAKLFEELTAKVNDPRLDNYKLLRQKITENNEGSSKRAFCFRTKNYECLDFIEELLEKTTVHYQRKIDKDKLKIKFHRVFPNDFKVSPQVLMDREIDGIIKLVKEEKNDEDTLHYVLIIGNVAHIDSLLDLLNSPNENKKDLATKKPLISRNGFSVELSEYPSNINFCFVMNESDFENTNSANSFPVPLLDRLNQFYFDYDQRDEFGIIEEYQEDSRKNGTLSQPSTMIIKNYLNRFIGQLKELRPKLPKEENKFIVVLVTTDLMTSEEVNYFSEGAIDFIDKIKIGEKNPKFDFTKKVIVFAVDHTMEANYFVTVRNNIKTFNKTVKEKKYKVVNYWSSEYNKLYKMISEEGGQKPKINMKLPFPPDYKFLDNDGSINKLIKSKKADASKVFKAIILTLSPMMEEINFSQETEGGINKENTQIFFDSFIISQEDFENRVEEDSESIIVRSNQFQIEHDRFMRSILDQEKYGKKKNLIIVYHLRQNKRPEGLYYSKDWPVFWIQSISQSPLSQYQTTKIVDSILFEEEYKKNYREVFTILMKLVYNDLIINYELTIKDESLNKIFGKIIDLSINTFEKVRHKLFFFIDLIKGKQSDAPLLDFDIKNEFFDAILNNVPQLKSLVRLVILNCELLEKNCDIFLDKLAALSNDENPKFFDYDKLGELFEKAEIETRPYKQLPRENIFFPELILSHMMQICDAMKDNKEVPPIDRALLMEFNSVQIKSDDESLEANIKEFCFCYFINYHFDVLNYNEIYDIGDFVEDFIMKFLYLLKSS